MATERQLEANRRNAQKSTGPRSASGKKRSSENSYKHGLSKRPSSREFDRQSETLARQIAGPTDDNERLQLARDLAEGEIRLEEIRQLKIAMVESVKAGVGSNGAGSHTDCINDHELSRDFLATGDTIANAEEDEAHRDSVAIRNLSVELNKLIRYETRESVRRDKAMRKLLKN
jgi:hypothetical protein